MRCVGVHGRRESDRRSVAALVFIPPATASAAGNQTTHRLLHRRARACAKAERGPQVRRYDADDECNDDDVEQYMQCDDDECGLNACALALSTVFAAQARAVTGWTNKRVGTIRMRRFLFFVFFFTSAAML